MPRHMCGSKKGSTESGASAYARSRLLAYGFTESLPETSSHLAEKFGGKNLNRYSATFGELAR
jgi:hypothetical protein